MKLLAYLKGYIPDLPFLWWISIIVVVITVGMIMQKVGIKQKMTFRQYGATLLLVAYVLLFFMSAVLVREAKMEARYNLVFLWTYKAWLFDGLYFLPEIVGNIIMMIPFSIFLPIFFSYWISRSDHQMCVTLFTGILISIMIEMAQYLLHRGLADIDDIFNNAVGVLVGFLLQWLAMVICNWCKKITNLLGGTMEM